MASGCDQIEADLVFSLAERRSIAGVFWYRATKSSAGPDAATGLDRLVVESATQTAPFDLPGGSTWEPRNYADPAQSHGQP